MRGKLTHVSQQQTALLQKFGRNIILRIFADKVLSVIHFFYKWNKLFMNLDLCFLSQTAIKDLFAPNP